MPRQPRIPRAMSSGARMMFVMHVRSQPRSVKDDGKDVDYHNHDNYDSYEKEKMGIMMRKTSCALVYKWFHVLAPWHPSPLFKYPYHQQRQEKL